MNRWMKHKNIAVFMLVILMLFNSIPIYAATSSVDYGVDTVSSASINYDNITDVNGKNFNGKIKVEGKDVDLSGISEFKGARATLKIEDENNKIKFFDQKKTDGNGKLDFKTELEKNKEYKGILNILREKIEFIFNTNVREEVKGEVSFRIEGRERNLLKETNIEVVYGKDTILESLVRALEEAGIDYKLSNNLIDEIAGEKDFQWMVNNKGGMYGPEYKLQAGDEIVLIDGEIVDPIITEILLEDNEIRLVDKATEQGLAEETILIGQDEYKLDEEGKLSKDQLKLSPGKYEVIFKGDKNLIRSSPKSLVIEGKERATIAIEKFTLGQGYIVEPIELEFEKGINVAELLTNYLDENGIKYQNTGEVANSFYLSRLYDEESMGELKVPKYILDKTGDLEKKDDPWLGEFDFYNTSGWMYKLNNEFPKVGMSSMFPEDGDVIRFQFTIYGLGADLGDSFMASEKIVNVANKDDLTALVGKINSDLDRDEYLRDRKFKALYEEAYESLINLESSQEETDRINKALKLRYEEVLNGIELVDKSKLETEIGRLEKLELYKYTHETRNSLKKALEEGKILLTSEEVTQEIIDAKVREIIELYGKLKKYDGFITLSIDKETIRDIAGVDVKDPLKATKVGFMKGETAWDVLKRELEDRDIEVDYNYTEQYDAVYVEWIDGDGEFDHGEGSGWMYNVNGWYPNFGVSKYILEDGDVMQWRYTTNYGVDLGSDITNWPDREDIPRVIKRIDALDKSFYSQEELEIIEVIIKKSEKIYENERTPQKELTAEIQKLEDLEQKIKNKERLIEISLDISKLEKIIKEVETKDLNRYTEESKESLLRILDEAKKTLKDKNVSQEEIDAKLLDLKKCLRSLRLVDNTPEGEVPAWDIHLQNTLDLMYKNTPEPKLGTGGGEWTILSLARGDYPVDEGYYEGYYKRIEEVVKNKKNNLHRVKYTEHSRLILGLSAIGKNVEDVGGYSQLEKLADFNTLKKQGINGPIFGLIALDSNGYEIPVVEGLKLHTTRDMLIDYILEREIKRTGGWSLTGTNPDPDITAMAIQSLAPYYEKRADVKLAVDRGLKWLSDSQREDGGYYSWGSVNSESCSQVIVALTSLGIDPHKDPRFIKNGNSVIDGLMSHYYPGGGFVHVRAGESSGGGEGEGGSGELNGMATDQGSYALIAYKRFLEGRNCLYDMTDVFE